MNKIKKNRTKYYCSNCGKNGHLYKNCKDPVTSYGIINVLISNNDIVESIIRKYSFEKGLEKNIPNIYPDSKGIKFSSPNDINLFSIYKNDIKFLMIQRKHTLGYIEFIRGRYNIENVDGIIFLFRQMTIKEIKKIGKNSFDSLWEDLWPNNKNKSNYHNEYLISKNKFLKLKNIKDEDYLNLDFYVKNVIPNWDCPEWGFPKGRRNYKESDINCATREFAEETGFNSDDYIILDKLYPIQENLIGTNGIQYKHVYYITMSVTNKIPVINKNNKEQTDEIGDIGWFTYDEAIKMIRPYHTERRKLLTQLYMYIINTILDSINKNNNIALEEEII